MDKLQNMPSQPGNNRQSGMLWPKAEAVNPVNKSIAKPASDDQGNASMGDIQKIGSLLEQLLLHYPMIMYGGMGQTMMQLRANYPFLPIAPYSVQNAVVNSDGINAIDIIIPTNAALVKFDANAAFVANFMGVANVPTVPSTTQIDATLQNCGMINPTDAWIYIPNTKTVSVLSIGGTGIIGASFIVPRQ